MVVGSSGDGWEKCDVVDECFNVCRSSAAAKQQIPVSSEDQQQGNSGLAASSRFWNPPATPPNAEPTRPTPNGARGDGAGASVAAAAGRRHVRTVGRCRSSATHR